MHQFDKYFKINSHCFFTGAASTDEGKGSIWLIAISNEGTNVPDVTGEVIIKWIDN